jgi:hypothetical protein
MNVTATELPPVEPAVEVTLTLTADEARKLRTIVGHNGQDTYRFYSSLYSSTYFRAAFPDYEDFRRLTSDIFHGISDSHKSLAQPSFGEGGRSY